MSNLDKKPYKGCRDFFPELKRKQNFIFARMQKIATLHGFEPYDGPMLEMIELYKAKSGEELINDQIYSFVDRGNREVAIRPEMTPTLARMVASIHREISKPIRWFSIPNLMRYEKPQRGRLREHWQFNCDVFGAPKSFGELEVLQVIKNLLTSFGATSEHFAIYINDRKIVDALFNALNLSEEKSYKLIKLIDRSKKISLESLDQAADEILDPKQKKIFLNYLQLKNFHEAKIFIEENLNLADIELFDLVEMATSTSLSEFLSFDPSIVRGLDYYTGIVFEVFDLNPENKRAICGGGSYANLLQIFNEPALSGVGFGLGDVTLVDFLETHNLLSDFSKASFEVFLSISTDQALNSSFHLAENLRKMNISVEHHPNPVKPKKAIQIASKKGIQKVIFIGEEEIGKNIFKIKDLESGTEKEFSYTDFSHIKEFLK
jgi:histidyl-tRNA synthetase